MRSETFSEDFILQAVLWGSTHLTYGKVPVRCGNFSVSVLHAKLYDWFVMDGKGMLLSAEEVENLNDILKPECIRTGAL